MLDMLDHILPSLSPNLASRPATPSGPLATSLEPSASSPTMPSWFALSLCAPELPAQQKMSFQRFANGIPDYRLSRHFLRHLLYQSRIKQRHFPSRTFPRPSEWIFDTRASVTPAPTAVTVLAAAAAAAASPVAKQLQKPGHRFA